jgi:hypothetical protein
MRIKTESGSVYTIEHEIVRKHDADGRMVDAFKLWEMKAIPEVPITWEKLFDLPKTPPVVGQHAFISGRDSWWLTTKVVAIDDYQDQSV